MLLVSVVAAVCAAVKTDEKNPFGADVEEEIDRFSGVGAKGGEVRFERRLGPTPLAPEADRTLLWDIMFPEADVIIFELLGLGDANLGESTGSVGVGGVLIMRGALTSLVGGVCGRPLLVSIL
jgi:hypothetical protein